MLKRKKTTVRGKGRKRIYVMEAALLAAVIISAILAPQMLFRIQDGLLYGRTELGRLESADVELLGSVYEKDMHLRMLGFAQRLEAGDRFYAAAKNLTENQELWDYLYSDKGMYQGLMTVLLNLELLYTFFWDYGCTVSQWKQYVVYSDNYAQGISFLLWYIELQSGNGAVLKLLADGETGTVYAVKTEGNQALTINDSDMGGYRDIVYREFFYDDDGCTEMLYYLMACYEAQGWEELYAAMTEETLYYDDGRFRYNDEALIRALAGNAAYTRSGDAILFQLPYEEAALEFCLKIGGINMDAAFDEKEGLDYVFMYPDMTAGIRQLYELIPEFS